LELLEAFFKSFPVSRKSSWQIARDLKNTNASKIIRGYPSLPE